ncbi:MAG: hypothetical protein JWO41_743 [Candidatus Saccharibacteria bacterium]|nr:hypothetical protein [Candidatus Saccharibacteria bacterium]
MPLHEGDTQDPLSFASEISRTSIDLFMHKLLDNPALAKEIQARVYAVNPALVNIAVRNAQAHSDEGIDPQTSYMDGVRDFLGFMLTQKETELKQETIKELEAMFAATEGGTQAA